MCDDRASKPCETVAEAIIEMELAAFRAAVEELRELAPSLSPEEKTRARAELDKIGDLIREEETIWTKMH